MDIITRNSNFHADEIQALLRACLDLGIEEMRSAGERIEPVMYDVQQRMNAYGDFPERKLYCLKKYYFKLERDFRSGVMKPYPPEARQLWGSTDEHDVEAEENDKAWQTRLQCLFDRRRSYTHINKIESKVLIREALERNVESLLPHEQTEVFEAILVVLHTRKLFLNRDAQQLRTVYLKLRKRFLDGKWEYPSPEVQKLWILGDEQPRKETVVDSNMITGSSETENRSDTQDDEEFNEMDDSEKCRICKARLFSKAKDLFADIYKNQTYGEIIQETIHVKFEYNGSVDSRICQLCSTFVESLLLFVRQCQESCKLFVVSNDSDSKHVNPDEVFVQDQLSQIEFLDEHAHMQYDDDMGDNLDDHKVNDSYPEIPRDDTPIDSLSNEPSENNTNQATTQEQKYRKFVESRGVRKKQCHICGKSVLSIRNHMLTHTKNDVKCELCPKICTNPKQLRVHMNIHTKKRQFPCRYCDRVFYVWKTRSSHEEQHMDEKNNLLHKCSECDAVYSSKNNLEFHRKHRHLGIRHLQCNKCDFSTFIRTRLLNHVRSIHTSERPYQCTVCDHTANSSTGYYIHFQRHKKSGEASEYSIKCAYCGLVFSKDVALEHHLKDDHPDKAVDV